MKFLLVLTVLFSFCGLAFGQENDGEQSEPTPVTRVFKVDWKKKEKQRNDSATMMCDDTYYSKAELWIPESANFDTKNIEKQCPGMVVKRMDIVVTPEGDSFDRFLLDGDMDCDFEIVKPVSKTDAKNKAKPVKYSISIADAC